MKNYLKRFFYEEDGTELIEWAIGIAIVAILAGTVFGIAQVANRKMLDAEEAIGKIDPNAIIDSAGGNIDPDAGTGAAD